MRRSSSEGTTTEQDGERQPAGTAMGSFPRSQGGGLWVARRFPSYGRACLAIGAFLVPIAVHSGAASRFGTAKITVVWFTALLAVGFWITSAFVRRVWLPHSRVAWVGLALVGATAIATLFSLSPRLSLVGIHGRNLGLVSIVLYISIMLAMIGLYWERPHLMRSLVGAIGMGSVVLAVSIILEQAGIERTYWPGPIPGSPWPYPNGLGGNSNFAGASLGLALPCLSYLVLTTCHRLGRAALGGAIALDVVALWYTQSRGGMLAGVAGLTVMVLCCPERRRHWISAAVTTGCVLAVVIVAVVLVARDEQGSSQQGDDGGVLRSATLQYRLYYWEAAVRSFLDHPIVGTGPDTFYAYYPRYRPPADGDDLTVLVTVDAPHNVLLARASDTGVLGLGSYLLLIGLALRYGWRRCRQLDGHASVLLSALLGVLAAYLAQGFFSIDVAALAMTSWIAIGGIAALADPATVLARAKRHRELARGPSLRAEGDPRPRVARPRPLSYVVIGIAVVGLGSIGMRPLRADIEHYRGRFAEAIRLFPLDTKYRGDAAFASLVAGAETDDPAAKTRHLIQARGLYDEALRLQPDDVYTMVRMADVETAWASSLDPSRFAEAEAWWQRVLALDPNNKLLRNEHDGNFRGAQRATVARLQAAADARPEDSGPRVDLAKAYLALGDSELARDALSNALRLDPENTVARRLLSTIQATPPR